ncbi:MAG: dockerin type I domain-containing protein [Planctomycetota bacterium]
MSDDGLGRAIAVDTGRLIAGSPFAYEDTVQTGAADLFVINPATGIISQPGIRLPLPPSAAEDLRFGTSVAIDGDRLVVGATGLEVGGVRRGAAYVYAFDGSEWTLEAELTPSDHAEETSFGSAVAIAGETIAIGAPEDDFGVAGSTRPFGGSVYIYSYDAGAGTWTETATLFAVDDIFDFLSIGNDFGRRIALSGDVLAVGAPRDLTQPDQDGAVYTYSRNMGEADAWGLLERIAPPPGAPAQFGYDVALDGDTLLSMTAPVQNIGIGTVTGPGPVYVFEGVGSGWSAAGLLMDLDTGQPAEVNTIALSGDIAVGGRPLTFFTTGQVGDVTAFGRNYGGTGAWGQLATYEVTQFAGPSLGRDVAVDGRVFVAGSTYTSGGAGDQTPGAVFGFVSAQTDCNGNDAPDACDITRGLSIDCNGNGIPDECESFSSSEDCDGNGALDSCELDARLAFDCNGNGILDSCDIASGFSQDLNGDGIPDECNNCTTNIVFAVDTSGSTEAELDDLCNFVIERLQQELPGLIDGALVAAYAIEGGSFDCFSDSVVEAITDQVPDSGDPAVQMLCGDTIQSTEDWGHAAAVVASNFKWYPGARTRVVVTFSDEEACDGDLGTLEADEDAILNASLIASASGVRVIAMTHGGKASVVSQADTLSSSTGATSIHLSDLTNNWSLAYDALLAQVLDFREADCITCPGDVNGDGHVDIFDFSVVASNFGMAVTPFTMGDLDGDGEVNVFDFSILASNFGNICEPPGPCEPGYEPGPGHPNDLFYCDDDWRTFVLEPFVRSLVPIICDGLTALGAPERCASVSSTTYVEAIPDESTLIVFIDDGGPALRLRFDNDTTLPPSQLGLYASFVQSARDGTRADPNEELLAFVQDQTIGGIAMVFDKIGLLQLAWGIYKGVETASDPCFLEDLLRLLADFVSPPGNDLFCVVDCDLVTDKVLTPFGFGSVGTLSDVLRFVMYYQCPLICDLYQAAVDADTRADQRLAIIYVANFVPCP